MGRYFFHIAYQGTCYRGWQRQPNVRSVQAVIEDCLANVLHRPQMTIVGCGRTDAEVHASQFYFHTDLGDMDTNHLQFVLNKQLPKDISILDILRTADKSHARFDAKSRRYDYFISTLKHPLLHSLCSYYDCTEIDIKKMQQAAALIGQYEDFAAFCKQPKKHNTTICHIASSRLLIDKSKQLIRYQIVANRFLRGMIRILVQKILEVGQGTYSLAELQKAFETNQRLPSLKPAYPQGLYLSAVEYDFIPSTDNYILPFEDRHWEEV